MKNLIFKKWLINRIFFQWGLNKILGKQPPYWINPILSLIIGISLLCFSFKGSPSTSTLFWLLLTLYAGLEITPSKQYSPFCLHFDRYIGRFWSMGISAIFCLSAWNFQQSSVTVLLLIYLYQSRLISFDTLPIRKPFAMIWPLFLLLSSYIPYIYKALTTYSFYSLALSEWICFIGLSLLFTLRIFKLCKDPNYLTYTAFYLGISALFLILLNQVSIEAISFLLLSYHLSYGATLMRAKLFHKPFPFPDIFILLSAVILRIIGFDPHALTWICALYFWLKYTALKNRVHLHFIKHG